MSASISGVAGLWTVSYSCNTVEFMEGEIGTKFDFDGCMDNVTYLLHKQAKVCYCYSELCNKPVPSDKIDPNSEDPGLTNSVTSLSFGAGMKIYLYFSVFLFYANLERAVIRSKLGIKIQHFT